MRIGEAGAFYGIQFRWTESTLQLRRGHEFVADIHKVVAIQTEERDEPDSEQVVMLLRVTCADGAVRVLFLDSDPVQSNAREVAAHITRLDDVYSWLLEPGYVVRQGDLGVYALDAVPAGATAIARQEYQDVFEDVLSKRHALEPDDVCDFFAVADELVVRLSAPARLIHPEHRPASLTPGVYAIRGARGTPLPSFVGLRDGERRSMED